MLSEKHRRGTIYHTHESGFSLRGRKITLTRNFFAARDNIRYLRQIATPLSLAGEVRARWYLHPDGAQKRTVIHELFINKPAVNKNKIPDPGEILVPNCSTTEMESRWWAESRAETENEIRNGIRDKIECERLGLDPGASGHRCPEMTLRHDILHCPIPFSPQHVFGLDLDGNTESTSIHSAATPLGSMISGPVMEAAGRRRTLQISTLPLVLGWILIGTATHHALLLLGRIVCGFAVGILAATSQRPSSRNSRLSIAIESGTGIVTKSDTGIRTESDTGIGDDDGGITGFIIDITNSANENGIRIEIENETGQVIDSKNVIRIENGTNIQCKESEFKSRMVSKLGLPLQKKGPLVYIGEISEPRLRGLLIGTPFVAYSLGVLYVYMLGSALDWRAVAHLCIVLPALSFVALALSPESPTWLARHGKFHEAAAAMARLRGDMDTGSVLENGKTEPLWDLSLSVGPYITANLL
ncbi:Putative sugar transporter ERD6-like 13 [Eumeta japonica]|uniref:Sugar transporter ERD6-like 13 n=1 Tax=Eumeta variegata TaxID=151549 RepID=A0A4C1U8X4_EUMVA|nr:Putative sugar transporter ERD6-like 13 [Eumeta japonica]